MASDTPPVRFDAAALRLHVYPDPILRRRAAAVPEGAAELAAARAAAARMIELMRQEEGIGLAGPQAGVSWRMFVADVPPAEPGKAGEPGRSAEAVGDEPPAATRGPVVYLNPEVVSTEGPPEPFEEGCLSLPDIRGDVLRPPVVTLRWTDLEGQRHTLRAGGLLARCWQHEIDHLDGVLIIDRFTQMSRLKNRASVRQLEKRAEG